MIYMYALQWRVFEIVDFLKITIGSCKFMQLAISCKYICAHGFDGSTNPILLEIDIHVRYTMVHVWNNRFSKK